jgi:hypothetical protein
MAMWLAKVCVRSWNLESSIPARRQAAVKAVLMLAMALGDTGVLRRVLTGRSLFRLCSPFQKVKTYSDRSSRSLLISLKSRPRLGLMGTWRAWSVFVLLGRSGRFLGSASHPPADHELPGELILLLDLVPQFVPTRGFRPWPACSPPFHTNVDLPQILCDLESVERQRSVVE